MTDLKRCWRAVLLIVLFASCQKDPAVVGPDEIRKQAEQQPLLDGVHLTVDKATYSAADTIRVRLQNHGEEPVFLEGCSQLFLEARVETGWTEAPLWVCVWEGFAMKIAADSSYKLAWPAAYLRAGTYRFVAPLSFGCRDGQPISAAQCTSRDTIYSQEFVVVLQVAGQLRIATEKNAYRWTSNDLNASRLIQATLTNTSHTTFYARLGDGYNSSLDQQELFVAQGSGGHIERQHDDSSWQPMPRGILFEGTRFIALRPQQNHRMLATLQQWIGNESGQFRFKVEYFDRLDPAPVVLPMVDYSNVFVITMTAVKRHECSPGPSQIWPCPLYWKSSA